MAVSRYLTENIKKIRAMSDEEALYWYLRGRQCFDNPEILEYQYKDEFYELFNRARKAFKELDIYVINFQISIVNSGEEFRSETK